MNSVDLSLTVAKFDASLRVFVVEFEEHSGKSFTYYQKNVTMFNVANNLVRETVTIAGGTSQIVALDVKDVFFKIGKYKWYKEYQKEVL